jgi:hypothetical protein
MTTSSIKEKWLWKALPSARPSGFRLSLETKLTSTPQRRSAEDAERTDVYLSGSSGCRSTFSIISYFSLPFFDYCFIPIRSRANIDATHLKSFLCELCASVDLDVAFH